MNSPNGPTITISNPDDIDAGSTHQVTFSGNPLFGGYNVEYVNGTLTYSGGRQVAVTPGYRHAGAADHHGEQCHDRGGPDGADFHREL